MYARISGSVIISVLLFSTGCVGVEKYLVSKPTTEAEEIRVTQNGEIKLGDVVIVFRPANTMLRSSSEYLTLVPIWRYEPDEPMFSSPYYEDGRASSVNFFVLELVISPGKKHVAFDPKTVVLKTPESKEIIPTNYKKLSVTRGWYSIYYPKYSAAICEQEKAEDNDVNQPIQLSGGRDSCLAIKYDVPPPDPRTSFTIHIKGLSVDGKNINVPIIKFIPGMHRDQHAQKTESERDLF